MKRAIVVDDNDTVREGIVRILENIDYVVMPFTNATDALLFLTKHDTNHLEYKIILTDFRMPKMDGVQFIKAVRTLTKYKAITIICISSEIDVEIKNRVINAGANFWIQKSKLRVELIPLLEKLD